MSHLVKSVQRIFLPKIHRTYHQRMWLSLKMVEIIFHIKNPLNKPKEAIVKFRSSFSLIMIVEFVLQPKTFCSFIAKFAQRLKVGELSDTLLFETSEKARYTELSSLDKMREWIVSQGISKAEFNKVVHSSEVKEDVNNAINLTEEYGVFTFPYVVVGGKYVLTASTLYNDDYGVAVLDFLVNKLEQERKK